MSTLKHPSVIALAACLVGAVPFAAQGGPDVAAPPSGWFAVEARTPQDLQELFQPGGGRLPLLSAHRGGAGPGFPENCLATFEETLRHTWSMLEIDLQYTKDGVLVLHHDPTVNRTTNGTGRVADQTLAELRRLRLKDRRGTLTDHRIPTLDETMQWARGKTILVLDKKDVPVKDAVRKITEHRAESYVMLMAYSARDIKECHALNPDVMMEVMVGTPERFEEVDRTGVPWRNFIAFVGHTQTPSAELCRRIRAKGASCMVGSSRNLDRQFLGGRVATVEPLRADYQALLGLGADIIETDIPRELGPMLFGGLPLPPGKARFFAAGRP